MIFGTDGLFSPGTFTINGSYVSSFGPDITAIPADAAIAAAAKAKYGSFGTFGPPVFAATHVIDEAIASVCKAGQTPSRSNVLAAIKTDERADLDPRASRSPSTPTATWSTASSSCSRSTRRASTS